MNNFPRSNPIFSGTNMFGAFAIAHVALFDFSFGTINSPSGPAAARAAASATPWQPTSLKTILDGFNNLGVSNSSTAALKKRRGFFNFSDSCWSASSSILRSIETRNKDFTKSDPKIHLSTIHGAKGGEADNVMLLTDLSRKSQEAMEKDSDDECRVFYVAATRARNELHVVQPQRDGGFII